jgi:hypothetical protein
MTDDVHFIVINYQTSSALPAYVDSLLSQDCQSWRMTVVDNSADRQETQRLIATARVSSSVQIRAAPRNLGYFGAANWLVSQPGFQHATWTVVSNMDIALRDTTFVSRLLTFDNSAPVLAPSILSLRNGRPQNPYLATRPSARSMRRRRFMLGNPIVAQVANVAGAIKLRLRPRERAEPNLRRQSVYAPHGSMIVFHRRYFVEGGRLAHPVFLFNEEINVAEQCRRLRLPVTFEPALRVVHETHKSLGLLRSPANLRAMRDAAEYGYRLIRAAPPLPVPPMPVPPVPVPPLPVPPLPVPPSAEPRGDGGPPKGFFASGAGSHTAGY